MLHSSMVLERGVRQYSTLDLCEVDLYRGKCKIWKVGAATTFIRKSQSVEEITSSSLPMGMLQETEVEAQQIRLENGDMIFIISDGVVDALPSGESEKLLIYFIEHLTNDNPAESAQILLNQILEFCQDGVPDDMTILAGGFWKK